MAISPVSHHTGTPALTPAPEAPPRLPGGGSAREPAGVAPAVGVVPPDAAAAVDGTTLREALQLIADFVSPHASLEFSIDEATEHTVVKVLDAGTGEVIRQFPSQDALAISKSLDRLSGLLLRQKA